jgi:hypothetical protein
MAVPPGPFNVNVDALIVAGSITELKLAVTTVSKGTATVPFAGKVANTVGDVGLDARIPLHPAARAANATATDNLCTVFTNLNLRIDFYRSNRCEGTAFSISVTACLARSHWR